MAGIGFVLRKLTREDNLVGFIRAYFHSAMASAGPWIFTIASLGIIALVGQHETSREELYAFRSIIIYNFSFSLVLCAPVFMVVTRYLADAIYDQNVSNTPGMLFGAMMLMYVTQLPIVVAFYFIITDFPPLLAVSAVANFMLISTIWLISVFLTALKDFKSITGSFLLGLILAILSSLLLAEEFGASGILNGFSIGLVFILASLMANIFAEYQYPVKRIFALLPHFKKHWQVAVGGFIFNVAAWVDKWIMWFAPEAERTPNGLFLYSHYDSAMFVAYLTIIPTIALFVFSVETVFYESYLRFYRDIHHKVSLDRIGENHKSLIGVILGNSRNILVLQVSISILAILMAPQIFELLDMNYLQLGIFRYGVLGAFFHVFIIFLVILFAYFDNQGDALKVQVLFLISNVICTVYFMRLGYDYYGYGYYIATVITFVLAAIMFANYVNRLPFHTFVTQNAKK